MKDHYQIGELYFIRSHAPDESGDYGYFARTPFGTRYEVQFGIVNGSRDRWGAVYHCYDEDAPDLVDHDTSLSDAMRSCLDHYRHMLMDALADMHIVVAGLPMLPPEGSPEFSQEAVDNWTPAK